MAKKAQTGAQPVYGGNQTTDVEYGSLPDLVVQQLQTQSISQVQANNPYGKLPLAQRGSGPVLPVLAPAQPPPQTGYSFYIIWNMRIDRFIWLFYEI